MMPIVLVRLDKNIHDRKGFDCGQPELNQFLQIQAAQSARRELSRTMVLVDTSIPSRDRIIYVLLGHPIRNVDHFHW